jgi:hypothetical protein
MSRCKIYRPPANLAPRGTILAFHGGCFVGGSIEWDRDQNIALASLGFTVVQPEFPKTLHSFKKWADSFSLGDIVVPGTQKCPPPPIFCLGRSSGGYLVKEFLWSCPILEKALYICPVFQPLLRAKLKPQFQDKTMRFFKKEPPLDTTENWDGGEHELLLLATKDENVPKACYSKTQLDEAVYLGPTTHSGMCKITSQKFLKLVDKFFVPVP